MEKLNVKRAIISKQGKDSKNYQDFMQIVKEKQIKVIVVKNGDELNIEKNIKFEVLWPREEQIKENILNNNSLVIKLNYNNFSMLLTGDIEKIAEEQILNEYKNVNNLKSTVMKIAHHGSKTSSTERFLEKVRPQIALIGVGENNTFGHPSDSVVKRLESLRSKNL